MLIQSGCRVDVSRVTGDSDTESIDSILDEEPQSPESGEVEDEEATPVTLQFGAAARAALAGLDRVDLEAEFTTRACVMKSPPAFVKGQYRAAMRFALVGLTEHVQPGIIWQQQRRGSCSYCYNCTNLRGVVRYQRTG